MVSNPKIKWFFGAHCSSSSSQTTSHFSNTRPKAHPIEINCSKALEPVLPSNGRFARMIVGSSQKLLISKRQSVKERRPWFSGKAWTSMSWIDELRQWVIFWWREFWCYDASWFCQAAALGGGSSCKDMWWKDVAKASIIQRMVPLVPMNLWSQSTLAKCIALTEIKHLSEAIESSKLPWCDTNEI